MIVYQNCICSSPNAEPASGGGPSKKSKVAKDDGNKKLPSVPETLLKKRKQRAERRAERVQKHILSKKVAEISLPFALGLV